MPPVQPRVLNTAGTHVWMCNPDTGGVWECPLDYADIAVRRGFVHRAVQLVRFACRRRIAHGVRIDYRPALRHRRDNLAKRLRKACVSN